MRKRTRGLILDDSGILPGHLENAFVQVISQSCEERGGQVYM